MRLIAKNTRDKQFVCFLHFLGLENIQLGFHINLMEPNVELHLPFCFIRIGWQGIHTHMEDTPYRSFGKRFRI